MTNKTRHQRQHNFIRRLHELQAASGIPAGTVHVHVAHDSWCRRLRGGRCNCEPSFTFSPRPPASIRN